jgi:hypothetical protein
MMLILLSNWFINPVSWFCDLVILFVVKSVDTVCCLTPFVVFGDFVRNHSENYTASHDAYSPLQLVHQSCELVL